MGCTVANCCILLRIGVNVDKGARPVAICISVDVERDYRRDGSLSVRGIQEGLPSFVDVLRSRGVPLDLFISGEITDAFPRGLVDDRTAIGCHGMWHPRGPRSYMKRLSAQAQRREIDGATARVSAAVGRTPIHFRAPNFSANSTTISELERAGYLVDSSVLPGRYVKRWRLLPLLDFRGAPLSPYHPDPSRLTREGLSRILEVPLTPNVMLPGGPLGLGFLNSAGPDDFIRATLAAPTRYVTLLAHTWEMVDWESGDPVESWVRSGASSNLSGVSRFLDYFSDSVFVNMDSILASESGRGEARSVRPTR